MMQSKRKGVEFLVFVMVMALGIPEAVQAQPEVADHLRPGSTGDTPLAFERIAITKRTDTSLTVLWETNRPARGRIQFGRNRPDREVLRTSRRDQHKNVFRSLTPGTTYRFRVFARAGSEPGVKSQVIEAKTTGIPPPRVENFELHDRTMTGGILRWRTNIPTSLTLRAGHDTPLQYRVRQDTPSRFHQIKLNRFYPDRPLHYRVTITDTYGNTREFNRKSFRTREPNYAFEASVRGTFDQPIYGVDKSDTGSTDWNQRIVDGRYSYSKGTANSGNPSDTDQYFVLNLGEFVKPGRAVFYWRDLAYPRDYEIHGSRTGAYWTPIRANLDADNGTHTLTPTGNTKAMKHVVTVPDTAHQYQLIRVRIPKGSDYYAKYSAYDFVQLHEFKLFPDSIPEPGETDRKADPSAPRSVSRSRENTRQISREVIGSPHDGN